MRLHRWGIQGTERLGHLSKLTEAVIRRAVTSLTFFSLTPESALYHLTWASWAYSWQALMPPAGVGQPEPRLGAVGPKCANQRL